MIRLKPSFTCYWVALIFSFAGKAMAQQSPLIPALERKPLALHDLSTFEDIKSANWKIVGNVTGDRAKTKDLKMQTGKEILGYLPKPNGSKTIKTRLTHGDIDLHMDFLLSKSANFSIFLQERYEIKITDEWLKKGNNALKAPGLWQHLSIRFSAPAFDSQGRKIRPARLEEVAINGQTVQTATDIMRSQNSPHADEKTIGAILFQGGHTSFALRNISYKIYNTESLVLSDINFKVYKGLHKTVDTLRTMHPLRTGITDTLSHLVGDCKSQLTFEGFADIPTDGEYLFRLTAGGGAWLFIDDKLMIENRGSRDFEKPFYAKQTLKKGKYPFKLVYSNSDECLVLAYEGPEIPWRSLTTAASIRHGEKLDPLEYNPEKKPAIQRGFMMQKGIVNPYIAAVGIPGTDPLPGLNYAFDLKNYNLSAVWQGRFIDVSNMWTERGEKQLEIPLGAKLELPGKPLLSGSIPENTAWPDSVPAPDGVYQNRGYQLNKEGFPIFHYALGSTSVQDYWHPNESKTGLTRELKITNTSATVYGLLAEGKVIEKLDDGGYAVDDKNYYLSTLQASGLEIKIIRDALGDKLIVTLRPKKDSVMIKYDLIW